MSFIEQIMLLFKQQKQACCIALAGLVLSLEKSACLCLQQQGLKVCSITPSLPPPKKIENTKRILYQDFNQQTVTNLPLQSLPIVCAVASTNVLQCL